MCVPLLCASSWDRELTATLHSAQYSSFLALSSSVSGLLEAGTEAAAPRDPDPVPCSGTPPPLVLMHPGEEGDWGTRGGRGVCSRGHRAVMGESMGGVGGVLSGGSGPGARRSNGARGPNSSENKKIRRKVCHMLQNVFKYIRGCGFQKQTADSQKVLNVFIIFMLLPRLSPLMNAIHFCFY